MTGTLAEQILSHSVGRTVQPNELIVVEPDVVMSHDSLTPDIIGIMQDDMGVRNVHNPKQLVIVMDHVAPASTVGIANKQSTTRRFARQQGIRFFDVGYGICHQVLVEERIAGPGKVIMGADSHSTSYGAVGAFGSGMGSTDIALLWATGKTWLRVPETIRVDVTGQFRPHVGAKDLALKLEKDLTIAGATYAALEYHGLDWLPLHDRQTLSGMAVELGAKAGIFYPNGALSGQYEVPDWLELDMSTDYEHMHIADLTDLEPQVALPHAVDNVVNVSDVAGRAVDVVFLGTCTNGRYEDMRTAAEIIGERHIDPGVRFIVTPASSRELRRASDDGTLNRLLAAGATLTTPGCGTCMGRHQGTLGDGEVSLSTGNRNFRGRMGSPNADIYLSSPAVAAATAITGVITPPAEL